MTGAPSGFAYQTRKSGEVIITHFGTHAATLRGRKAAEFLTQMSNASRDDQQHLMARLTGNYLRGNERTARDHGRNG